jgi:predicted ATPase
MLNGQAINLGTVTDVVDKVHGRRTFQIGLIDDKQSYHWSFTGERDEMSMAVSRATIGSEETDLEEGLHYLLPNNPDGPTQALASRLTRMTYVTAERLGPRDVYPLEDPQVAPVVGPKGEYAVSVLHLGREEKVLDDLTLEGTPPTRLRQVEARMKLFFPSCGFVVEQVSKVNSVTIRLRNSEDTDFHSPIHVGFGLTQIFPIIVAALSASENDILLIENPEVHLHPAGQALVGQFLAEVANAGVQVIIETHSDHVLNGIRRAVKASDIPADQVALHFFRPRTNGHAQLVSPRLDSSGNVDTWPEGFFDQFDKDMNYFAGWGEVVESSTE